jgi:diguanylate cyclase (GGDEF)-like protein
LLYIDLDQFKEINDNFGHDAGDTVLKKVAERLREILRQEDSIARLGGDEFAVLLRESNCDITDLASRILNVLRQPIFHKHHKLEVSTSIGIALLGVDTDNFTDLIRFADLALYKAKDSGGNKYHFFSEQLESIVLKKAERLKDLANAIENDQLELYYQTQHDIIDNRIVGVEALIRWSHPDDGLIFPDEMIPLAEESGLIVPIGEWIINRACRDAKILNRMAGPITIAINLSVRQFDDPTLKDIIVNSCRAHGLPHELVELEITESLLINDMEASLKTLENMKKEGFRIALDDFGMGYSSLFYLKSLPVTGIKIDKSFTMGLPSDSKDTAIVDTTILLAHSLNLNVVAEGIETEEQLAYLHLAQCDTVQGYLLGKPQPLDVLLERLEHQQVSPLAALQS